MESLIVFTYQGPFFLVLRRLMAPFNKEEPLSFFIGLAKLAEIGRRGGFRSHS